MVFDLSAFAVTAALAYNAFTKYNMNLVWRIIRIGAFGAAMGNLLDSLINNLFSKEFNYLTVLFTVVLTLYAIVRHDKLTKQYAQIMAEKKEAKRQKRQEVVNKLRGAIAFINCTSSCCLLTQ